MKKIQLICGALLFATTTSVFAAAQYVAADDNPTSKLCVSAAIDSPVRLEVAMRDLGVNKRYVANQVSCNGMNIASFAEYAGNHANYKMLSRYRREHVSIHDLAQQPASATTMIAISGRIVEAAKR